MVYVENSFKISKKFIKKWNKNTLFSNYYNRNEYNNNFYFENDTFFVKRAIYRFV